MAASDGSSIHRTGNGATHASAQTLGRKTVVLPVSDVDRAKAFYAGLGWRIDADIASGHHRLVRLTPPGSDASIIFGTGVTDAQPGEGDRLALVVDDIDAAREALSARGAVVGDSHFSDPDGNVWVLNPASPGDPPAAA